MNDDLALYNRLTSGASNPQTQLYNALGRNAGTGGNFFTKRASSIGNAVGTTLSAPISLAHDIGENIATQKFLGDSKSRMNEVAKKYGYNSYHDVWDARDKAEAEGDQATLDFINNTINPELQAQANANAEEATAKAKGYEDYRKNNLVSKNINQDNAKFLGSAINTLSTAVDLTGLGANPLANAIQGGVEGIADELEQNGGTIDIWNIPEKGVQAKNWDNFSVERAGQNALIGAATGAVTGALNKGVSNALAKNGGNLFKGGNALTRGLNTLGSSTALGRAGSTIATGVGRGALSGAVGGATGAGISAAMNNQDVIGSALQGAVQGAQSGALTGGVMAGANMALSRTPLMRQINQAQEDWRKSGKNFDERLTNTLTSGNSAVGEWLQGNRRSGLINTAGTIGNRIADVSGDLEGAVSGPTAASSNRLGPTAKKDSVWYSENAGDYPEDYQKGYLGDSASKARIKNYNEATGFVSSIVKGDYKDLSDADLINIYNKLPAEAQSDVLNVGRQFLTDEFLDKLASNSSTPTTAKGWSNKDVLAADATVYKDLLTEINQLEHERASVGDYYRYGSQKYDNAVEDINYQLNSAYSQLEEIENRHDANWVRQASDEYLSTRNNPTTAKGWLKRAGERIVEDANDRGVGLSIKNVADDAKTARDYTTTRTPGPDQSIQKAAKDIYDQISNKYGDAVAESSFRDLRYLADDYSDYDTATGASILKDVYDRMANRSGGEDVRRWIEQSGVFPSSSRTTTNDIGELGANGAQPQNQETEVYRTLTGGNSQWDNIAQEAGYRNYDEVAQRFVEANPNAKVNAGAVLNWLDNNQQTVQPDAANVAPMKSSKETKLRYAQGKELLAQYGSIDQPMSRATKAAETFQELAEMGFVKPGDVERISNAVTGSNGAVSKLNNSIVASAKPVNTFDGELDGQTIDEYIDRRIEKNYLSGTNEGKAVKRGIKAYFNGLPSRTEGSVGFEDSAADTFKMVQQLEASAAELEGRGGSTYHRPSTADLHQAAVIKDVANLLKDRIYSGADVKSAITPEVVSNLKALDPGNEAWATTVDKFASSATSPKDLRSFQRPFVRANRYIDNQYVQAATVGGRMAASAGELPAILPTTKAGIVKQIVNSGWNSNTAHRLRANLYGKLADKAAEKAGTTTPDLQPITPTETKADTGLIRLSNTGTAAGTTIPTANTYNPSTQIYNAIGRNAGLQNGEQARTANYLADAVNQTNGETAVNNGTLESLVNPGTQTTAAQNSVYNSLYGTNGTVATANTAGQYFQPTGDYWTDLLGRALSSAIEADDVEAFAALYGMYQDAISKQQSASTSSQKLTATQQRANAAMNSLQRLSGMTPDLGYNLSNIPIIGGIATFGGNDYESEAKSLAQQIGYMVSGSNIKDSEAENIGKSYVPQPWDNEQTRQNKLRRAYEIIQQYQNGYATE